MEKFAENAGIALADEDARALALTPRKMATVGLLGAVASMALYYLYHMLGEDTKEKIREQVSAVLKSSIQKITVE